MKNFLVVLTETEALSMEVRELEVLKVMEN